MKILNIKRRIVIGSIFVFISDFALKWFILFREDQDLIRIATVSLIVSISYGLIMYFLLKPKIKQ